MCKHLWKFAYDSGIEIEDDDMAAYSESKNTEAIIADVTNHAEDLFFPTEVEVDLPGYAQEEEEEEAELAK